ncbi:hypothetical protein IE53DRAFT_367895 [Violaceomyces palustris]|uniref:Uncharacterized protein n=1 Tax=Violaceomyces palustris TaxID=1673888 RepID=A0ACD0P0M1_9BASI|nr:hypothetical protein IE53DRAFT_367895 [Violaceomyces palustris]
MVFQHSFWEERATVYAFRLLKVSQAHSSKTDPPCRPLPPAAAGGLPLTPPVAVAPPSSSIPLSSCGIAPETSQGWQHFDQPDLICRVHASAPPSTNGGSLVECSSGGLGGGLPGQSVASNDSSLSSVSAAYGEQSDLAAVSTTPTKGSRRKLSLTVEWRRDGAGVGGQASADWNSIILETIDLVGLSTSVNDLSLKTQSGQVSKTEPPIKAVYRDQLVGLRYQRKDGKWHRLQMKFSSLSDCQLFLGLIQSDCHVFHDKRRLDRGKENLAIPLRATTTNHHQPSFQNKSDPVCTLGSDRSSQYSVGNAMVKLWTQQPCSSSQAPSENTQGGGGDGKASIMNYERRPISLQPLLGRDQALGGGGERMEPGWQEASLACKSASVDPRFDGIFEEILESCEMFDLVL